MTTFLQESNMKVVFETVRDNGINISYDMMKLRANQFIQKEDIRKYSLFELNTKFIMDIYTTGKQNTIQEIKPSEFEYTATDFIRINPPAPVFKHEEQDEPIAEMEDLVRKTMAQRNFDVEQIYQKIEPVPPPTPPTQVQLQQEPVSLLIKERDRERDKDKHIKWKDEQPPVVKFDFAKLKPAESQIDIILIEIRDVKETINKILEKIK